MLEVLIKSVILIAGLMTAAAYLVLVERWMAAWIQDRLGPNRVGIPLTRFRLFGLGQPIADGVKFIFKEEFTPRQVDKFLYSAAPVAIFTTAAAVFAVVPFGSVRIPGMDRPIHLVVAPLLDVDMIYVFAVGSIGVYGVVLGGWASNDKYSFLGGLRSGAQLISYEIPLGLGILGVVLASGSLRLETIIAAQAYSGVWNILVQPLGFLVFVVAACAEAERLPFDLAEAEQELVGGYHTEYSGMKLMMYLVAEFFHMILAAMLIVILFLGGWHLWGLTGWHEIAPWPVALLRVAVMLGKVGLVILAFMIARWSWPRFRFDQLMSLAWQVVLPLGIVNLMVVAVGTEYGPRWAKALGIAPALLASAVGWGVLVVSWVAMMLLVPATSDNTPRRDRPVRARGSGFRNQPPALLRTLNPEP
jgi:NADH-quinone oxidoreductase subunit H